ncbi:glycosyltransferase, partial [Acinetobacter baumannii]
ARLVPKKNLTMALEAYALYHRNAEQPRELHLCGSGPLEQQLVAQAAALGISESVCFRGWLQERDTCLTLATTLALLLPSVEEQFGN